MIYELARHTKKDNYLYVYINYTNDYVLGIRYPNHYSQLYKLSPEIFFLASLKNNPLKDYNTKIRKFVPISQQIVYKNRLNY